MAGVTIEKQLRNIEDAYRWPLETAARLRAGDFPRINTEELIDEIESSAPLGWDAFQKTPTTGWWPKARLHKDAAATDQRDGQRPH
ncbi:MAG: DUF29 domain-containing protein [Bryobacterales bacterium]|nr:DUF29 domain-containing protein [Bryobacterales bacterium]